MAAVAGPLDRRCSSAVSVDIDPGWYEGQPETADAADEAAVLLSTAAPADAAGAARQPVAGDEAAAASASAAPAAAAAPAGPGSHVPTVLKKLQKWGDYESFGQPVWPTKFIPMKTPLSHEILDNWQLPEAPKHRLTVSTLLEAQQAAGRRVGLLLDLSNHDCLYDTDIPPGVDYLHVQLVAKELPPLEFVQEVGRAAAAFWAAHPDMYIAVHCAYGFNRTGFVLCSYLIEHCGLTVDQALQSFAAARPPGVKHEKFRLELERRYGNRNSSSSSAVSSAVSAVPQLSASAQPSSSAVSSSASDVTAAGAAFAWPAGSSPGSAHASGGHEELLQPASSCSLSSSSQACQPTTAAAAAAAVCAGPSGCSAPAIAAGVPRCRCCNAELTPEELAAVGAAPVAAAAKCSLPYCSSSPPDYQPSSSSNTSCFARSSSSSTGAPASQTPPPPPLPPLLSPLSAGGSRHSGVLLSSSPAALRSSSPGLRMPARCWSGHSIGDNSSIGCSPTSSAADLVTLRTSGQGSAAGDTSSMAGGGGGLPGTPSHVSGGGGVGRCSSSGGTGAELLCLGGEDDGDVEAAEGSGAEEEGCFEMDPYVDPPPASGQQQQQQQCGGFNSSSLQSNGRRKTVTFEDAPCCELAGSGCGSGQQQQEQQQLHHADLDSLLATVSLTHQQQQQLAGQQLMRPQQQQQQQQWLAAVSQCGCSCHDPQSSAVSGGSTQAAGVSGAAAASRSGGASSLPQDDSRQLFGGRPGGGVEGRLGSTGQPPLRQYSSDDGVLDPLEAEPESFGSRLTGDLLSRIRTNLQQADGAGA